MNIRTGAVRLLSPRRVPALAALLLAIGTTAGCAHHLSFNQRPSYRAVEQAQSLDATGMGPIAIEWSPASFPDRIDEIGPSGHEGSGRLATIPTGVALSARTAELLDAAIGILPSAGAKVTIEVREAKSEYRFAQVFITARHINWAQCTLDAGFRWGEHHWDQRFFARATTNDTDMKGAALLERVWDDVALGVVKNVVANLPDSPVDATHAVVESTAPVKGARKDAAALAEKIEAFKRILIRKGLITEAEWEEVLVEILGEER